MVRIKSVELAEETKRETKYDDPHVVGMACGRRTRTATVVLDVETDADLDRVHAALRGLEGDDSRPDGLTPWRDYARTLPLVQALVQRGADDATAAGYLAAEVERLKRLVAEMSLAAPPKPITLDGVTLEPRGALAVGT